MNLICNIFPKLGYIVGRNLKSTLSSEIGDYISIDKRILDQIKIDSNPHHYNKNLLEYTKNGCNIGNGKLHPKEKKI